MKNNRTKKIMGMALLTIASSGCASAASRSPASSAGYYRVWQGFQNEKTKGNDKLLTELPSFMKETVELYGKSQALNQYFVVIPPKNKPSFIPDELALVGLTSESDYQKVRSSPEGKRYSERHWDIFEKEKSQSAKALLNYFEAKPSRLESTVAYSMFSPNLNWAEGYSLVYIGTRKRDITPDLYLNRLQNHIELAAKHLGPQGLRGYIVQANENYEVAYLNWLSKEQHDLAFTTEGGKAVFADAGEFMDTLMYEPAFDLVAGETIDHGRFYKAHNSQQKALIVVTSHSSLGTSGRKTGYYFPEVAHPYFELSKEGIQVDIASPQGGIAPMDPNSLNLKDSVSATLHSDKNFMQKLNSTKKVSELDPSMYSAVIYAGGHGTMWDFRNSTAIEMLTKRIYENGGIVAAVCHGPAALVDVKLSDGSYLVSGKNITGFSNDEEEAVHLTQTMPFLLENDLVSHGAHFQKAQLWQENVVIDGRLITGQNPASASSVGRAVAKQIR